MPQADNDEKERKRKKQARKMGKIVSSVWEFDAGYHDDLSAIGQKIDDSSYKLGKSGWTDFARDLGAVYTQHIVGKTDRATSAKKHLKAVEEILGNVNESLAKIAATATPSTTSKRKSDSNAATAPRNSKKPKTEIEARSIRAMEQLRNFIVEKGGTVAMVAGYTAGVTARTSNKAFDINFFNPAGQRFRSMLQVGRHLKLVKNNSNGRSSSRKPSSKEQDAEKKKIRKDLERLKKALGRANKALDEWDVSHPAIAHVVEEDNDEQLQRPFPLAAARQPDYRGFPGFPDVCTPDILQAWDFLCVFSRPLALEPMQLDDFVEALCYKPPTGHTGDDIVSAPVYLAEAHLGLLKMLFSDRSSDDWWWSILETDETEGIKMQAQEHVEDNAVIRFDLAAALSCPEDPLITQSWLRVLEQSNKSKSAVKEALKIVSNKWIAAYLRKCLKVSSTDRAVDWIVRRCRQARPDLATTNATVSQNVINEARAKAVEEATQHMDALAQTAPCVADDDVVSDWEEEDDEESDDEEDLPADKEEEKEEKLASALPPKPLPTFVDMLLPPEKPSAVSEFLNSFTWSHLAGATAARVVHRKKRILNETDDKLREAAGLPHLTAAERRDREAEACSRFLTECCIGVDIDSVVRKLCTGGNYLDLDPRERLCLLRILIDASFDTARVHEVVTGNFKQKVSAEKALDVEQRRAKREAKEKASADESAARQRLYNDAKREFIEARREEIREINAKSKEKEFEDDEIDLLTEQDIIDFDDDFNANFNALPAPESFSKQEVSQMVTRLHEEAAFDTDSLEILSMDELLRLEKMKLADMKKQLADLEGGNKELDESLDRDTVRSIDRLRRSIERSESEVETLPVVREAALQQLREAMEEGTIKVLRVAYATARKAGLVGKDEESGSLWAVDEVRAVAMELEKAKQNKRVLDAQRDLVTKRNRCFIRTEPIGRDRLGNRFWTFTHDEASNDLGQVWTQAEFVISRNEHAIDGTPPPGCIDLAKDPTDVAFGAADKEEDLVGSMQDKELGELFGRREYHSTGFTSKRVSFYWGCHGTEESLRSVAKNLSPRVDCEQDLKAKLKESLEIHGAGGEAGEKSVSTQEDQENNSTQDIRTDGDETAFDTARKTVMDLDDVDSGSLLGMASGIGAIVRVRQVVDDIQNPSIARYQNCKVDAWKQVLVQEELENTEEMEVDERPQSVEVPSWRAVTEHGSSTWLSAAELVDSISRYAKWKNGQGYFEDDAAFFSYRNTFGRHCGKISDAPYSASPSFFAKLMIKRESELYPKMKTRSYENTWGGQSGARAMWTNSMRDYAYDFETVKQGLSTLENAFFQLTRGFTEYKNIDESTVDVPSLLSNPGDVFDIELESMDRDLQGLWNGPKARAVFLHIVEASTTTGFLALAFDLLCRNTLKYLQVHKLLTVASEAAPAPTVRVTRRMNAWQQQQEGGW